MKKCSRCKQIKSVTNFNKNKRFKDGLNSFCRQCLKKYNSTISEVMHKYSRKFHYKLKAEAINHYGGRCACCGETELDFLTLDHINDDGALQRKQLRDAGKTYHAIGSVKMLGYPKIFQVLCANCNLSKRINKGKCIHQIKKLK